MPREAAVRKAVRDELSKRGALIIPYSAYPHGMPGVPDLLCCYRGIFLGVEVKRPEAGSDLSPRQAAVHDLIRESGGVVIVARGREDVVAIISALDTALDGLLAGKVFSLKRWISGLLADVALPNLPRLS